MHPPMRPLAVLSLLTLLLAGLSVTSAVPAAAAETRRIVYSQWDSDAELASGRLRGVRVENGSLVMGRPLRTRRYHDPVTGRTKKYDVSAWLSPWTRPGFALTELVPSWSARSVKDSWVSVWVRGRSRDGRVSSWDELGRWSPRDGHFHRTSSGPQPDDLAHVAVDTWKAHDGVAFRAWQVRVMLHRRTGTAGTPVVETVGGVASRLPTGSVTTSEPGVASGTELALPSYSQMIHAGEYPQYGGGGRAWCSPTSVSMVLGYYGRLPRPREYRWVDPSYPDRFVAHAARSTYDYGYGGTGNWAFNTAWAARRTGHAFVTRLRSLREAERFVAAGIPLVVSISFSKGGLTGSPLTSTPGHLVVVAGFTAKGDVIVHDPAAESNDTVRRVYDRGQFENAWLRRSGGLTYVIRTDEVGLPARGRNRNW